MKTKICTECKQEKELSEFYLDSRYKNRYRTKCKDCMQEKGKKYYNKNIEYFSKIHAEYHKKNKLKRNAEGKKFYIEQKNKMPWLYTLKAIKSRCYNKNRVSYKYYGGRGIECRITVDELKELWFRDKAYKMKRPSIDRIDNDGHYEYNNCRYIEQSENSKKSNRKKRKI